MNLGEETEKREFKLGLGQLDKGLRSLSAMLNRSTEGTVYFGVDDDGTVKGLDIGKKTLLDIRSRAAELSLLLTVQQVLDYFKLINLPQKVDLTAGVRLETVIFHGGGTSYRHLHI